MEIHQLRYFVAVADLGSFTRAAEKCEVAQPSLSQQIIKLEKELGRPLFERLGRKVQLTDAGRHFYDQAASILTTVDEARRRLSEAADDGTGQIAVGAIPTVAPYILPDLLGRFLEQFPKAEVTIHENVTEMTVRACLEGELDVGIMALPLDHDQLIVEPLTSEELLLAVPAEHPLANRRSVTMADLDGEPFILLDEAHCLGAQVVRFCEQQSCRPLVRCHTAQLLTVQELVARGHGISLVPEMAARADQSGRSVYRSLRDPKPTRTLAMAWHRHRYQSPLVRRLAELLRNLR